MMQLRWRGKPSLGSDVSTHVEYRKLASLALALANTAGTSSEKMWLLVMADGWRELAERARIQSGEHSERRGRPGQWSLTRRKAPVSLFSFGLPRARALALSLTPLKQPAATKRRHGNAV